MSSIRRRLASPAGLAVTGIVVIGLAVGLGVQFAPHRAPLPSIARPTGAPTPSASAADPAVAVDDLRVPVRNPGAMGAGASAPAEGGTSGSSEPGASASYVDSGDDAAEAVESDAAAPAPGPGEARYVASNGDDDGPGTVARPWRSPAHAAAAAPAGSTIYLRGGTYPGFAVTR